MRCRFILVGVVLLVCPCVIANGTPAPTTRSTATGGPVVARSPPAVAERLQVIDNAIAAALVSAISAQLGGRVVDMRLDAVDMQPLGGRDRALSGTGSLRIDGDDDWIGFRFQLAYDSRRGITGYPQISIGGVAAGERDIPNDAVLVRQIEARLVASLSKSLRQQPVQLQLDRITTVEAGRHYLRIDADGIAYLGLEGSVGIRIEAFYDLSRDRWLYLQYNLGSSVEHGSRKLSIADL